MPIIIAIIVIGILVLVFRPGVKAHRIKGARLGFFDLTEDRSCPYVADDKAALADLFDSVAVSADVCPTCDVLFLYGTLGPSGLLRGTDKTLRQVIRESGAKIVVVASENGNPQSVKASPGEAKANLVITTHRNGIKFGRFFRELFSRMKKGQTMPMAWVGIVPQGPSPKHDDCPGTIFLMEIGPLRF